MEVSARRNCGYPGISPEECASRKCCFSDNIFEVPWCFFPMSVDGNVRAGRGGNRGRGGGLPGPEPTLASRPSTPGPWAPWGPGQHQAALRASPECRPS